MPVVQVGTPALPTGSATSANQTTIIGHLDGVEGLLTTIDADTSSMSSNLTSLAAEDFATETTLNAIKTAVELIDNAISGSEMQVDVVSSALPTGASTLAEQQSQTTLLGTIDTDTGSMAASLTSIAAEDFATETTLSAMSTKLTDASQKTQIVDGSGNVIGSTSNALDVNIKSGVTLEVNLDNAADDVLVYGFDGTDNQKIKTDANGELQVDVLSSALPSGAATSALQTSSEAILTTIDADTGSMAASLTSIAAEDFATETTSAAILAKIIAAPATEAKQDTIIVDTGAIKTSVQLIDDAIQTDASSPSTKAMAIGGHNAGATQFNILHVDNSGHLKADILTSGLPTGASTSANQTTIIGHLDGVEGLLTTIDADTGSIDSKIPANLTVTATRLLVDGSGVTQPISGTVTTVDTGYSNVEFIRNDYSSTNVTTAAYVELIASTSNAYKEIEIFDSSGQTLKLAFGAAASEVDKMLIFPGGNSTVRLAVPAATRISIKAVSATASVGEISINFRG
jgi:hypothetical protein